jgi:3-oxoacyl-[acyl-carrier protein] reductase
MTGLAGKHVLISGGGSGIGRAIALGAAEAGADVVVTGRRAECLEETCASAIGALGSISMCVADVTDARSVRTLLDFCDARWSHIDGLVNCAGITVIGYAEQLTDDDFARVLDVNLVGSFRMSRDVGRRMIEHGSGSIINIGSLTSLGGFPGRAAYTVSKHGVIGLTKALAAEWGSRGVRVNALIPGFVRTPMTETAVARGVLDLDSIEARTPAGRRAEPEEIVGPALFLLSDAAGFVTGDCLVADGGWTAYLGPVNRFGQPPVG